MHVMLAIIWSRSKPVITVSSVPCGVQKASISKNSFRLQVGKTLVSLLNISQFLLSDDKEGFRNVPLSGMRRQEYLYLFFLLLSHWNPVWPTDRWSLNLHKLCLNRSFSPPPPAPFFFFLIFLTLCLLSFGMQEELVSPDTSAARTANRDSLFIQRKCSPSQRGSSVFLCC